MANTFYQNKKAVSRGENFQKIWDEYAKFYDKILFASCFQDTAKNLFNCILPCPNRLVHEGGCGTGYWLKDILEKTQAKKIIATDISSEMLRKAKEKVSKMPRDYQEKIEFRKIDLTKDWPEEIFDAQIFQLVANYLPGENWKRMIEMTYKTIKDNGYLYSSTLLKGLDVEQTAKKHTLKEVLHIPISSFLPAIKAGRLMRWIDRFIEEGKIILPTKDEYLEYHRKVGFRKVEMIGKIFWGAGITVRAQK